MLRDSTTRIQLLVAQARDIGYADAGGLVEHGRQAMEDLRCRALFAEGPDVAADALLSVVQRRRKRTRPVARLPGHPFRYDSTAGVELGERIGCYILDSHLTARGRQSVEGPEVTAEASRKLR